MRISARLGRLSIVFAFIVSLFPALSIKADVKAGQGTHPGYYRYPTIHGDTVILRRKAICGP